jgi:hypothetical protein
MKRLSEVAPYLVGIALVLFLCYTSATFCAPETEVDTRTNAVTLEVAVDTPVEARIVLVAPRSVRVGELVRLDVSESTADNWKWSMVPGSDDFLVYDSGGRAVFSARKPGKYQVFVSCAKNGSIDHTVFTIMVVGPPDMPVGDNLAEWIPFWMWPLDLPSTTAELLAASFEGIAAKANELTTPKEWIEVTAEANRKVLGENIEDWRPILDKIGEMLLKKAENGELVTPEDHKKVWLEIAEGLRAC